MGNVEIGFEVRSSNVHAKIKRFSFSKSMKEQSATLCEDDPLAEGLLRASKLKREVIEKSRVKCLLTSPKPDSITHIPYEFSQHIFIQVCKMLFRLPGCIL